jgi:hypothetical protein
MRQQEGEMTEVLGRTAGERGGAASSGAEPSRSAGISTASVVMGFSGLAIAVVFMTSLQLFAPQLNPIRTVMSDYALVEGVGWKLAASVTGVAVASIGAALGLANAGFLPTRLLRLTMVMTVTSALVAAAFATDEEFPLSLSGEIHRYGAITLFICVPIAGMLIAARLTDRPGLAGRRKWLLSSAWLAAGLLVVFLLSHLAVAPQILQDVRGLLQRLMMLAELVVLAQLIVLPRWQAAVARSW